jgi:hypothetical protein
VTGCRPRRALWLSLVLLICRAAGLPAATQTVLGVKFDVRDPRLTDPSARSVSVFAQEEPFSDNLLVGDPTVDGATLRIVVGGSGGTHDETYALPAAGWRTYLTRHDWPVYKVYQYSNESTGGPVRSVVVQRGGYASPEGTPPPVDPRPGEFRVKLRLAGRDGPIAVRPPNPGDSGVVLLGFGGGDTYCIAFGGPSGGRVITNTSRRFAVMRPALEGCPAGPAPAGE